MIHSFLMIGQSNMAGRGLLDEAETIDTAHIKILRNGRWQPMFRPINPDRPFSGVNLAESFAEQYAQTYGVDVGLIPCADMAAPALSNGSRAGCCSIMRCILPGWRNAPPPSPGCCGTRERRTVPRS